MNELPKIKDLIEMKKLYKENQEIGIEIEMEGDGVHNIKANKTWKVLDDGSLRGPESAEYVLYNPISILDVPKALQKLEDLLRIATAKKKPSDRCGVHIHLNIQYMTFEQVMNLICLYLLLEPVLVSFCGESREGNLFCLRTTDAEALVNLLIETRKYNDIYILNGAGNTYRYASINFAAIQKHGSLEFRAFRSPKSFKDIIPWINLLYDVKTHSLNFSNPEEIVESYSNVNGIDFLKKIFKKNVNYLLKNVTDIDLKLIKGVRQAQDIAYVQPIQPPITMKDLKKQEKKKIVNLNDIAINLRDHPDDIQFIAPLQHIQWAGEVPQYLQPIEEREVEAQEREVAREALRRNVIDHIARRRGENG